MNLTTIKTYLSRRKFNIIFSVCAFAAMWIIWIIAYYGVQNDFIIPSVSETVKSFFALFVSRSFWLGFLNTLLRTLLSFVVSLLLAALLVAVGTAYKSFQAFVKPFVDVARTVPTLAIILILLFWTTPVVAPVVVTFLVLFPMIYSQLLASVNGVGEDVIEMAGVYGIGAADKIKKIYLPKILADTLSQTGANISLGLKVMISAEVLAGTYKSIGGLMNYARMLPDMARLAALTIASVVIGLLIDLCFTAVDAQVFKWRKRERNV